MSSASTEKSKSGVRPSGENHWSRKLKAEMVSLQEKMTTLQIENEQLRTSQQAVSGVGEEHHGEGQGEERDGSEDSEDSEDSVPSDPEGEDESNEDKFINLTINKQFEDVGNSRKSCSFKVCGSWKAKSLRFFVQRKFKVPIQMQKMTMSNGNLIHFNITIEQNRLVNNSIVYLSLLITGGGKRSLASGNSSKQETTMRLEDMIGMNMLRFNAQPNASPAISALVQKITQATHIANQQDISMKQILRELDMGDLQKLLTVTSSSTKVESRSTKVAEVIFNQNYHMLLEVENQTKKAFQSLPLVAQLLLMKKYSDEAGNISWTQFTHDVSAVIQVKTRQDANADTSNASDGLSM